jgi:hypothetical protein
MDKKHFQEFDAEFVRIHKTAYKVIELTKDGFLSCLQLDSKGKVIPDKEPVVFDLNILPTYELTVIGPQPGWE